MNNTCCICPARIDENEAPILTHGRSTVPRYICPECEKRIDTAMLDKDPEKVTEACRELGESLTRYGVEDLAVVDEINGIIEGAMLRAKAIKEGTYDFSADEEIRTATEGDGEFDITDDIKETPEDRERDEKEAKRTKLFDTLTSWAAGLILVGAVVFFLIKFVF